ncbi:MAG: transglycosylase domain-containing protein [Patescibacteria group bacterium]
MRDQKRHRRRNRIRRILRWGAIGLSLTTVALALTVAFALWNLPDPGELFQRRVIQSTKIYDRTGAVLLYEIHGEERRTVIPLSEIPDVARQATITVEDTNFYQHHGVDLRGILRAFLTDVATGNLRQGGSTITQQLVKNALLGRERTLRRKIKEAALAIRLEARLSKDEILALYLNQIPYGSNAYGIEAAAETFFGKRSGDLLPQEAALLAALPAAPSYFSPYGQHKDELLNRKDYILKRMGELGYLSPEDATTARQAKLKFLPATKNIRAPHFVMSVRDYLTARYGEEEVEQGGLTVTTTLDWELQEAAERLVYEGAERNEKLIRASNMALVALNPKTGEILTMVGSRDYFDVDRDGNFNVATALRQPGSAFKPFVYATAFKKGFTPETVLFDVPTEFHPGCAPDGLPRPGSGARPEDCYHPQNFDNTFRGPVTVRQALAQSLNVPSVKLLYLAGVNDSIQTAEELGITTLTDPNRYGLSLVLGGAEVRLLEMVSAFGVFANDGVRNAPTAVLRVTDAAGRLLEERREVGRPVIDSEVARTVNDILSDNDARVPLFAPNSPLYFPDRRVAAKTGTTQDYRDAWTIGYTPSIAVGVWAGNNDNAPMQQKGSGVLASAPTWHAFLETAFQRLPIEDLPPPPPPSATKPILRGAWQGEHVITIDTVSKKRATEFTPLETRTDVAFGEPHDPLHWINRADPAGPPPDPRADPQYQNWEYAFRVWAEQNRFEGRDSSEAPKDFDDVHTPEKQPRLTIHATRAPAGGVILEIAAAAPYGVKEVTLLAEDEILASRREPIMPITFTLTADDVASRGNALEIRAYDYVGNIGSSPVAIP